MKNIIKTVRVVFAIAIVLLLISAKADKVTLKYNLKIGSTYQIKSTTEQSIEMTMMGQQQNIKSKMESAMSFKVVAIDGKVINFDSWYDKIIVSVEMGMGNMVMRSDSVQDSNPGSKILNAMMNKHFTIKMSEVGEIMDVSGSEKIMEDAISALKDQSQVATMKESIKQYASKDALKGSLESSMRCMPEKAVSVGDSWTSQAELTYIMTLITNTTWKLTDHKESIATLEGKSTLKSKESKTPQNINGIPIKYNINGEQEYLSKINEKTGWIIESTINQDISGEMEMDLSAQGSGVQKVPLKIKSKNIITGIQ